MQQRKFRPFSLSHSAFISFNEMWAMPLHDLIVCVSFYDFLRSIIFIKFTLFCFWGTIISGTLYDHVVCQDML